MDSKLRVELPLLLPDIDDPADACVDRLIDNLTARDGVVSAHIVAANGSEPAQLCIHFDPNVLPLQRIREIYRRAGRGTAPSVAEELRQPAPSLL